MRVCQTIRSLAAARLRVWAGVCLAACLVAAPAAAQAGHGPGGGRGGMRGHGFMAPAPPPSTEVARHRPLANLTREKRAAGPESLLPRRIDVMRIGLVLNKPEPRALADSAFAILYLRSQHSDCGYR